MYIILITILSVETMKMLLLYCLPLKNDGVFFILMFNAGILKILKFKTLLTSIICRTVYIIQLVFNLNVLWIWCFYDFAGCTMTV